MRHFFQALMFGVFFRGLGAVAFVCYPAQPGESLRVDECKEAMINVFTPATPLARNPHLAHLWTDSNPLTSLLGFARHGNCVVCLKTTTELNTKHDSLGQLMRAATFLLENCVQRNHVGGIITLGEVSIRMDHINAFTRVPGVTRAQSFQQAADTLSLSPPADEPRPSLPFQRQQDDASPALKQAADTLSLYPPGKKPWPGPPLLGSSAVAEIQPIMQGPPLQRESSRPHFTPFHLFPPLQHYSQAHTLKDGSQTGRCTLRAMPTLPARQRSRKSTY